MSEKEFYEGQKLILLPACNAVAADFRLLAYETYCFDYEDHIPISIKNHPLKVNDFRVIASPTAHHPENKALHISAVRKVVSERAELLEEVCGSDFTVELDCRIPNDEGMRRIEIGDCPIAAFTSNGTILFKGFASPKKYCVAKRLEVRLVIHGEEKKMDCWVDGEEAARNIAVKFEKPVREVRFTCENGSFEIERICCYRGCVPIDRAKIPEGVLVRFHGHRPAEAWRPYLRQNVSGREIVAAIRRRFPDGTHHRLYLTEERKNRILSRTADPQMADWLRGFLSEAEQYLHEEPPEFMIPDGIRLLATARLIKRRLLLFSSAWRLTGDRRFVTACLRFMEKASSYPHWNDTHFLDTAELCCGFSIAYDAIYECLTPEEKQRFSADIKNKALLPALLEYRYGNCRTRNQWSDNDGNWNPVCNAGMVIGAVAVAEDESELAEEIISSALSGITHNLAAFLPDGAWREGVGYWHYTVEFIVYFFDALLTAAGSTYGYLDCNAIYHTADYYLAMLGPGGSFNYGDMEPQYIQTPELYWYAEVLHRPELAGVYAQIEREYGFPTTVRAALHFRPEWNEVPATHFPPCDMIFGKWWVGSLRSSWDKNHSFYLAFQGGRPNAGHSQMSIGNFVFDAFGERWALDLGYDDYNLDYLDVSENADAWWIYRKSTEGHNCMLLNPDGKHFQVFDSDSPICGFQSKAGYACCRLDLSPAYRRQAKQAFRTFYLDKKQLTAAVLDEAELRTENSEYYWMMHTDAAITLSEDGTYAILRKNGKELYVTTFGSKGISFSVMDPIPLPSSPAIAVRKQEAKNPGVKKLILHLTGLSGQVQCGAVFSGRRIQDDPDYFLEIQHRCREENIDVTT